MSIILKTIWELYLDGNEAIREEFKNPFLTFLGFCFFQILFWGLSLALIGAILVSFIFYKGYFGFVIIGLFLFIEIAIFFGKKLQK